MALRGHQRPNVVTLSVLCSQLGSAGSGNNMRNSIAGKERGATIGMIGTFLTNSKTPKPDLF